MPAGFSTVRQLAERYGYGRAHVGRLIASGAISATYDRNLLRYLISAASEQRAVKAGVFQRGAHDKASIPLTQARSRER